MFDPKRPVSWSCLSSWEWNKESWYKSYVLGERDPATPAMLFGNTVGETLGTKDSMVPGIIAYPEMEYKLEAKLGKIKLIGYADSYHPEKKMLREYKTSQNAKRWNQDSVDKHGQLTMYALLLFLMDKVKPEDLKIHLDHIPTQENGDFSVSLVDPITINTFETKRTMKDILEFATYIKDTHKQMCEYTPEGV